MDVQHRNKAVVEAYVEAFNKGDFEHMQALFAPDAFIYGVFGSASLHDGVARWRELHAAFAVTLEIQGMIAEGDTVAVRYVERGRSVGPFLDKPVTGKSYEMVALEWFQLQDGRITRRWGARDSASQFAQMGI